MNRIVPLVVMAVCLAPLVGAGAALSDEEVTVTVTAVDPDGNAIGGASVTASWDGGERTAQTASNGQALIDVPAGADVSIVAEHDEYVQNNPKEIGTVTDHTTETVELAPPTDGQITVAEDGDPIADATVTLTKRGDDRPAAEGTTDTDGVFAVDDVETGVYEVTVEKAGYYEKSSTADFGAVDSASVDVESGTAEVAFTITDGYLEKPVAGEITVLKDGERDSTVSTNEKGKRSIDLPVNTMYTVVIEAEGYGEHERELGLGERDTSRSYKIERTPTLTLETVNSRVIVGETVGLKVTDEYDEPVEGASVRLDGSAVTTTDSSGSATVPIETTGDHELTVEADGTTSNTVVVEGVDPNGSGDGTTETESNDSAESIGGDRIPGFGAPAAVAVLGALVAVLVARRRP